MQVLRRGLLLLLILFAFAIRISGLTAQSLWRDEVDALGFSRAPMTTLIENLTRPGWNGPLFYIVLRFWIRLGGSTEFSLRYISLICSVLGVALTWRLGRDWFRPPVGGLASLLMACSPYMVWYAQEAKMYALLVTLALAALYLYYRTLMGRDWCSWIALIVLTWLVAGVHIMGLLIIPVMVTLFFVWWQESHQQWKQAALALLGTLLPGIAVLPWAIPLLLRGSDIGHRFASLPSMGMTMLYAFSRGIMIGGELWPMGLSIFALLASTLWTDGTWWTWAKQTVQGQRPAIPSVWREAPHVLAAWVWLIVPILGLYVISLRVPMFVDRYLIWIGPAFYLLMARGLEQVRRRSPLIFALCLSAILALHLGSIWQANSTPIKSDFRAAAAYMREHREPRELIMFHISYVRDTFEYYYGDSAPTADGLPTNEQTTQEMVDTTMRKRIKKHDVVWLVLSEPEMWDKRGLTAAWLDTHATQEIRVDFTRVSVLRYRMSPNAP